MENLETKNQENRQNKNSLKITNLSHHQNNQNKIYKINEPQLQLKKVKDNLKIRKNLKIITTLLHFKNWSLNIRVMILFLIMMEFCYKYNYDFITKFIQFYSLDNKDVVVSQIEIDN